MSQRISPSSDDPNRDLTEMGRRERELNSLYATARSLTALGELDDVLASIVTYAHELIGSDFTYLSVFDPEGNLTLLASEGVFSSGFRNARVPAKTGVAARVVESAAPYWVSDYLSQDDLIHDAEFDKVVADEGLKALLGVPLRASGAVIGILYAADRYERPFSPEEVAMFSAFADHAAVAIENARLFGETRHAYTRLRAAYKTIEDQVEAMRRSAAVHEDLTSVVLSGGTAGDVAQLLILHLGGCITVLDRWNTVLAVRSKADNDPGAITVTEVPSEVVEQARRTGHRVEYTDSSGATHHLAAVLAGSVYLGSVVLTRREDVHEIDGRTLERAAQIVGLVTLTQDALVEAEGRVRGELLTELLSAGPVTEGLRARAAARGLDFDRFDALLLADAGPRRLLETSRRLGTIAADWTGLAGEHLGRAILVLHTPDAEATAAAIHRRLRAELGGPVSVVLGRPTHAASDWASVFSLTDRCAAVARLVGGGDRGSTTDDYSMYALAFDPQRSEDLQRFLAGTIGPIIDYDQRRHADLVSSVLAYFDASGNVSQAARTMHVHVNTLLKRLDRVGDLIGADWREPEKALRTHFAVRLHALASAL